MAELLGVAGPHLFGQFAQQRQPLLSDADLDDAPPLRRAATVDQAALLQRVEQARDVRRPRHQPRRQVERLQASGVDAAQQAQRIVLLWCQGVGVE